VGVIQDGIKLIPKEQILSWNYVFDFGFDLLGAGIGLGVAWVVRKA
jgi:hypothetical protein